MKIKNVTINKYKAFTSEEKIPIEEKNIFIYGENGSGKSSFYYALKDFFQSSVEVLNMASLRNYTLTDGGIDCSIEIEFTGGVKNILNETTKNTNTTNISDANRLKSFITYKHLLGVHNVKLSEKIDVFELIINGVLKHFKSATISDNIEISKLWSDLIIEHNKDYGRGKEFYFARQKKASVERIAIKFNKVLDNLFHTNGSDYLAPAVNKILEKLYPNLKVEFTRINIKINQWGRINQDAKILLQITDNGILLDSHNPHFSLNEAKLSAIAISIFLGAIVKQSSFSKEIKTLFLDDILIGLDNENRLRLLDLLNEKGIDDKDKVFKDFQIFITTYDRHWYEVAKLNLKDWKFIEFYKGANGPEIFHNQKTNIEKAISYYNAFDFPASANYLRKECETLLKEKLLETYTVGKGLKGLVKPPDLETLIKRLKEFYDDLGIDPPIKLINNLHNYKSILFNPMSHSDLQSPIYKNDIELAFKTIQELNDIVLPKRNLLISKGQILDLSLPLINYTAQVKIATNIYIVENSGLKSISPINFSFDTWSREGIEFAAPTGNPPIPITSSEKLEKIKSSPFSVEKAVVGLNITYVDRGQPEITRDDLLSSLVSQGENLSIILAEALN